MSRKTKAELEAENAELRSLVAELERDSQNLRRYIKLLHHMGDEDQRNLKIETDAHKNVIQEVVKLSSPRIEREWAALERKKFLQSRFAEYRRQGLNITVSRHNANNDMVKKFGEKHRLKPRRLTDICKD